MPRTRTLLPLLSCLLTACTVAVPGTPVAVPNPKKPKPPLTIVLISPPGTDPAGKKLADAVKAYAAKRKGKVTELKTTGNPSTDGTVLSRAAQQKATVVVVAATVAADKLAPAIMSNTKQKFLVIGNCLGGTPPAHMTCTQNRDQEGVFLLGAEAGLLSTTGKVGSVVAVNTIPELKRFSAPFGQGAAAAKPGTTFQEAAIGTGTDGRAFNDPVKAGQLATQLGASHVMTSAFGGNAGVFQAAKAGGFGVFGMLEQDCADGGGTVVDTLVSHPDVVIKDAMDAIDAGQPGRLRSYGLKENALSVHALEADVATAQCTIAGKAEVIAKVRELREKIVTGELAVADPAK
ncbi:BMP family ABC transporter substrate-binding protein [Actinocrispum sp. NPDC049592]|uniref:BMP family ABC transporter substrate-binding protein n=1 Tax=Actinocrispum sp. NPDC049592 TaxID=3154835 RepID=UPI00344276BD